MLSAIRRLQKPVCAQINHLSAWRQTIVLLCSRLHAANYIQGYGRTGRALQICTECLPQVRSGSLRAISVVSCIQQKPLTLNENQHFAFLRNLGLPKCGMKARFKIIYKTAVLNNIYTTFHTVCVTLHTIKDATSCTELPKKKINYFVKVEFWWLF
jgi:hypothetical protein